MKKGQPLSYDSEVIPAIVEVSDRPVQCMSRKRLNEALKPWRIPGSANFVR